MNEIIEIESETLYLLHTHSLTGAHEWEKKLLGQERERLLLSGDHLTILGFTFGADYMSEEVAGFSPLWFPWGKYLCLLSLVIDLCACYSLR